MPLELTKPDQTEAITSLQRYFREELDQELGSMRAGFLLEYFLKEIAPFVYNQAVRDTESYFRAKLEDLPGTCFAPELTYWPKKRVKGPGDR